MTKGDGKGVKAWQQVARALERLSAEIPVEADTRRLSSMSDHEAIGYPTHQQAALMPRSSELQQHHERGRGAHRSAKGRRPPKGQSGRRAHSLARKTPNRVEPPGPDRVRYSRGGSLSAA
jgi:hypothetical protein